MADFCIIPKNGIKIRDELMEELNDKKIVYVYTEYDGLY